MISWGTTVWCLHSKLYLNSKFSGFGVWIDFNYFGTLAAFFYKTNSVKGYKHFFGVEFANGAYV